MKFIITAGGQGTKLWPISRDNYPKQFNNIIGNRTLFQMNVESLLKGYSSKDIYVSVTERYVDYVRKQTPQIPQENYIIEPHIRKATGPSTCYSMLHMEIKHPDEVIMYYVQPVVIRTPEDKYLGMIENIEKIVKKYRKFVTGGKYPLYPETGSDYQLLGNKVETGTTSEVYDATKFVTRPKTLEEAEQMLKTLPLALHCNHSTWTTKEFFEELKKYREDWFDVSMEMKKVIQNGGDSSKILEIYSKYSAGNIELFTKNLYEAGKVQVVILPFEWEHITTWNNIYEHQKREQDSTMCEQCVFVDSANNLVINKTNKVITGVGLKDMIIVQTEDALLVCPRNESGRIGEILSKLEIEGLSQYL